MTEHARDWLSPGVKGIGTASFLADVGHEIPTALLPSLLTSTLGAPASVLGLIEGVSNGLAGAARLGGGALADDPHRRRAVAIGGYTTTAVLAAGTGVATSVWQVGLLRAGAWTARGLRVPARNALLADVVEPSAYGRAYGFERSMDNLGAIFGPLLAMVLVAWLGTRWAIGVSVIPGVFAAMAIVYAIKHVDVPKRKESTPLRIRIRPVISVPGLGRLFAGMTSFEVANVAATLLILRATEVLTPGRGHDRAAVLALGLYVVYNVFATGASLLAGKIADKQSSQVVMVWGAVAFAVSYLGLALPISHWLTLLPWFIAAGVGIGCVETAEHSAVASMAPTDVRGSAFGLLAATQSVGNFVASVGAGILWSVVSPNAAFLALGVAMVVASMILTTTIPKTVPT